MHTNPHSFPGAAGPLLRGIHALAAWPHHSHNFHPVQYISPLRTITPPHRCSPRRSAYLERLDVSHNGFTGTLPASLGAFRNLVIVQLSHNNFTGHLPDSYRFLGTANWLQVWAAALACWGREGWGWE